MHGKNYRGFILEVHLFSNTLFLDPVCLLQGQQDEVRLHAGIGFVYATTTVIKLYHEVVTCICAVRNRVT